MVELLALLLICAGLGFFLAGAVGLLRFPDLHTRLHALTKADNLGLGLLVFGLLLSSDDLFGGLKLLLVWLLVLASSAAGAHLIAQRARCKERGEWKS
jgi:multicomponent Na+:H+ antiporter subunit G